MEPQCHPEKSRARSETDLQAEQDEFLLSGSISCVKLELIGGNNESQSKSPSVAVLDEIIERPSILVKPPQPPTFKAPLVPSKINKKTSADEDIKVTLDKISHENELKLAEMSMEEIEEMRKEIFESVPESFLNKLRNKGIKE